jgi:RNA polymerase sigma factor (sigma-70 family)
VLGLCRRVVGPAGLAEDAAQEAVIAAMLQLDRLRRTDRFGPWLAGIGLNICRLWLRERSRHVADGDWHRDEPADAAPDPAELAATAEVAAHVRAAVMALPRGQRAAVMLHYLAGLTQPEVAATLGVELGAVKTRLHKARRALREPLEALRPERTSRIKQPEETVTAESPDQAIEVVVNEVLINLETDRRVAILKEKDGDRILPIWMGHPDADAIVIKLKEIAVARPMTHDLALNLLAAAGVHVREVVVERLVENVYYATIAIEGPSGRAVVDARPSDGLSLAVRTGAPIKVRPDLMAAQAVTGAATDATDAATDAAVRDLIPSFTPHAARILLRARDETSVHLQRDWVGTGDVLLALLEDDESLAAGVLRARHVTAAKVEQAITDRHGRGTEPARAPARYRDVVKKVLDLAVAEAGRLGHARPGTAHLLLGMRVEGGTFALSILKNLGVGADELRDAVLDALEPGAPPEEQ